MNLLSTLKTYNLKGFLGANICIMVYCVKWLDMEHSIFIWFFLNRKEKLLRVLFECSSWKANFLSPFLKISLIYIFRSRLENTCDTWRDVTEWQLRDIWWSPPSIPQTSDNDTMSSQIPSYIITEARPRPGQKISTPWSGTLPHVLRRQQPAILMCLYRLSESGDLLQLRTMQIFTPGCLGAGWCAGADHSELASPHGWLTASYPQVQNREERSCCLFRAWLAS